MRYRFDNIPNLNTAFDYLEEVIKQLTGKKVSELPLVNQTPEMARFIKKVSETSYQEYIKIDGAIRLLSGGGGGSAFIEMRVSGGFIQWRDDPAGAWTNLIAIADLQGEPGPPGPPGTVEDGDKGDITVSGTGTVFTINPSKVIETKIADNAVTANKIASNAVVEAKINNNEVTEAKLKLSDNTTGDFSNIKHGFVPKGLDDPAKFLRSDGTWAAIVMAGLLTASLIAAIVNEINPVSNLSTVVTLTAS